MVTASLLCAVVVTADTWESGWESVAVGTRHTAMKLEITEIKVTGNGATTAVSIDYRYRDERHSQLSVSLKVTGDNGAQQLDVPVATLSGDLLVRAKSDWQTGRIVWAAGVDWPNQHPTQLKMRLVADDRMFLIVDISTGHAARFYPVTSLNAAPDDLTVNDAYKTTKIVLRRVPKGSFAMGGEGEATAPAHRVLLTQDYYLGVFEVTQKQWELVVGERPSAHDGDARPVENVSWSDIRGGAWPKGSPAMTTFLGRLRARTGLPFDLPTEAQWENACRAGTSGDFNMPAPDGSPNTQKGEGEDANLDPLAWYAGNSLSARHHDVGGKIPNALGLYDMHGNVYEWCRDWFGMYASESIDPTGSTIEMYRVFRGGSWFDHARHAASWARRSGAVDHKAQDIGFRVGLVPNW
jgi:formylglycine-generating enzyme required for sulfatase activity